MRDILSDKGDNRSVEMLTFAIGVCLLVGFAGADPPEALDPSNFMYTILRKNVSVCAGTLVDDGSKKITIATAAHCVYNMQSSTIFVSMNEKVMNVDRVIVHPYYMPPLKDYDIALIKIVKPSNKNFAEELKPVDISNKEPKNESDAISVVRWDWSSKNDTKPSVITAVVENRKSCRAKYEGRLTLSSKMLCANIQSAVVPDGSPLLFEDKLAGVASFGVTENLPKIYTNIANIEILSFINKYI